MAYESIGITITADGSIATGEFQRLDGVIAGVSQRIAASATNAQRELAGMAATARNAGSNLEQAFSSLKIRNSADIVSQAQAIRSALNQIRATGTTDEIARATEAARRQMAGLRQEFDGTKRKINEVSGAARDQGTLVSGMLGKIGAAAAGAAMALSVREMVAGLIEAQQAAQKLNNVLAYTAGKGGVAAEMEYLRTVTNKLGLDFSTASVAYGKFAAATKDTGITGTQMRSIFEGVAAASTQMGLSADETQGAFLALSQMASKGVVSAEELRGQLGERLPGAFNLAAKAMGVTTAELGKMLEKGQIMASDFLPKFGDALRNEFQAPLTSLAQEMNRFNSAWDLWKRELSTGTDGGGFGFLTRGLNESSAAMRTLGSEAGVVHKLLVAIGGFQAGAIGKGRFDAATVQQQKLEEYGDVTRRVRSLEGRNRTYLEQGELDNLRMQRAELKRELDVLAQEIGKKQFKLPDLAGEVAAQSAKQNERLKVYLDDVKNAPKAVKIAAEVEAENKAFQTAVVGLAETDKRYVDALRAHQARVNEIKQSGADKSGSNDESQMFSARIAAAKDAAKTEVDLIKDRVAQQLVSERDGIEQTLAAQESGFVRQAQLLKDHLAATKDAGERERVKQQIQALGNEAARADGAAAAARAKLDRKSTDLLEDYRRGNDLVLERIQREAELALMSERQRAVAQALYKVEDDGQKIRERAIRDITDETERTRALATVDALLAEQKEKVAAATEKSIDTQRSFEFGWKKAFESYADSAANAAKTAGDAFSGLSTAMEGSIKSFVKTGKVDFKSFGDAVIDTLIDIQMQSLRTNVLAPLMKDGGWLSGLFGGGSSTASSLGIGARDIDDSIGIASVFHDGGVVGAGGKSRSVPMSAFAGAQRFHSGGWPGLKADEVPAILQTGERVLKRGETGGGVVVNVIESPGNGGKVEQRQEGGQNVLDIWVDKIRGAIAGDIVRGDGAVPAALNATYGLNRVAGAY